MPTPFPSRQPAPTSWTGATKTKPTTHNSEWRCKSCRKLLGVHASGRLHLKIARAHEYLASYPVEASCRACGKLNLADGPPR